MRIPISALLSEALLQSAPAVCALKAKTAGTITMDANTGDWNLAKLTTETRRGQDRLAIPRWLGRSDLLLRRLPGQRDVADQRI